MNHCPLYKEEKLKGTSVLKREEKPEDEKSIFEKVYSEKASQAKYARHIANRTREMSREMAEQAELEKKGLSFLSEVNIYEKNSKL